MPPRVAARGGGLLPHPFTLTPMRTSGRSRLCGTIRPRTFAMRVPRFHGASLPVGVRTFLSAAVAHTERLSVEHQRTVAFILVARLLQLVRQIQHARARLANNEAIRLHDIR